MNASTMGRAVLRVAVVLALVAGCNKTDEPATKTAKAEKPAADAAKGEPKDKARGGGGSDEVVEGDAEEKTPDAEAQDELAGYDPRVVQAAKVAREIANAPDTADEVLASQQLDREKLDALMYEIASDPDLTEQYRIARGL